MPVPRGEKVNGAMTAKPDNIAMADDDDDDDAESGEEFYDVQKSRANDSLVSGGTLYLSARESTFDTNTNNTFDTAHEGMTSLETSHSYTPQHSVGEEDFHSDDDDDADDASTPRDSHNVSENPDGDFILPTGLRVSHGHNDSRDGSGPSKAKVAPSQPKVAPKPAAQQVTVTKPKVGLREENASRGDNDKKGAVALEQVRSKLDTIDGTQSDETEFLKSIMGDSIIQALVKVHDTLECGDDLEPVSVDNIELVKDIVQDLDDVKEPEARELGKLLRDGHFRAMIEAHDDIATKNYDPTSVSFELDEPDAEDVEPATPTEAIRMVGIRKTPDEPLGITVHVENKNLCVARIFPGSFIEKQGLLHVGDVIQEVNGQKVATPEQLQHIIKHSDGSVTFKVVPSYSDDQHVEQVYVKAHFNFDPARDNLIPSKEAGLPFREGDILQILNRKDKNWWQAMRVDDETRAGLIPSQEMEEKRKAFVRPDYDYTKSSLFCGMTKKKKKKQMFDAKHSEELDRCDIHIYEEVARLPPFQRKTLVLIGAPGVGRRSLKNLLLEHSPRTFGNVLPYTSRPQREGEYSGHTYHFASREDMEGDINNGGYLEHGEFQGHLYGIRLESLRSIIMEGKIPIVDCNPQAIKSVKTAEFMPFVVFIAAPSVEILRNMYELGKIEGWTSKTYKEGDFIRTVEESAKIERAYRQLFDTIIVNDNMDETYRTLIDHYETMSTEDQWVPISWVY